MTIRAVLSIAAALALASCGDPFVPRSGVVTMDDPGGGAFAAVSAGLQHTCALTTDGFAYCWGSNEFGQLGVPDDGTRCQRDDRQIACQLAPRAVSGSHRYLRIRAGGEHTCAIAIDNRIYCWGDNLYGELGVPSVRNSDSPIAAAVDANAQFMDLAAGGTHTCGLRTDSVLLCWGANESGQLGIAAIGTGTSVPTQTQTQQRFSSVAAGPRRTCARVADGAAYCWGSMWVSRSAAEVDVTRPQAQPLRVPQTPAFRMVSVGAGTTCGIGMASEPFCWEANAHGAVGDGSTTGSTVPQRVKTDLSFVSVSSGRRHTCGIAATGHAYCWGGAAQGQLGVSPASLASRCGSEACRRTPGRVSGWRLFAEISAGQGDHTCGLTVGGSIYCWGAGGMGQRGNGLRIPADWVPTRTLAPILVTAITASVPQSP